MGFLDFILRIRSLETINYEWEAFEIGKVFILSSIFSILVEAFLVWLIVRKLIANRIDEREYLSYRISKIIGQLIILAAEKKNQ